MSGPSNMVARTTSSARQTDEPRIIIEMGGDNIVIRSGLTIDRECTESLAHAVNAAAETGTVVVLDPDPIRCDDEFSAGVIARPCPDHVDCRTSAVEVAATGVLSVAADPGRWLVDVARGRFCRADRNLDVHFVETASWQPLVALSLTPVSVRALLTDGSFVSGRRAHLLEPA